jgi:DtxR family Mn-dependent transcriptional regulator
MGPGSSLLTFITTITLVIGIWKIYNTPWFIQNVLHTRKEQIEDILKQLFHVAQSGKAATFNAMAGALSMPNKKLVRLVEEMSEKGLIRIDDEKLVLTEDGEEYALRIVRVHRLWEKYLSEKTGFAPSEWHDIAEKKEHQLTREDAKQLSDTLGHPRFDPHGDPIPTDSGEIISPAWIPLPALSSKQTAKIVHIEDEPETIYKQIIAKKLHRGSQLKVIDTDDKQVIFESEGIKHKLSPIVASNINVELLNQQEIYEAGAVRLSALKPGEKGKVLTISSESRGASRRRLLDLGFVAGSNVEVAFENPLKEPKAYLIRNTLVALRNDQADYILIEKSA